MKSIPFSPPYVTEDTIEEVIDTLKSGWITTGPKTKLLEKKIESYTGVPRCHCINSATSGLLLALKWYGIGKGDEVIIPAYTYCATALVVKHCGATPVMVDINEKDFNIDTKEVAKAITTRTKAIIPVDIAGYPCNYDELKLLIEEKKSLFVPNGQSQKMIGRIITIADSAHAFGAEYNGLKIGFIADFTIFSFHAVKNLTTAEGGAVCINFDTKLADEIYSLLSLMSLNGQTKSALDKLKGSSWRYDVVIPGFKANMPDICAAIGLSQLKDYETMLTLRKQIFEAYTLQLSEHDWAIIPPKDSKNKKSSCHLYQLRIRNIDEDKRDRIIEDLAVLGISTNVHFIPLPMLTVFKKEFDIKEYKNTYSHYANEISLPIYPQLSKSELNYVIENLVKVVNDIL